MFIVRFRLMKKRKKKQNPLIYIRTGVRIRSIAGYVHSRARASSNVIFLSSRIFCIICPLATFAYMLHTYIHTHTHTHTYIHTPVQHTYTHTHSYIQTDILNVRFLAARATSNRATKKRNTREKRKKEREEKKEKEKGNEREARFR